ncbi:MULTISPECIES: F0F1 ATP synthase subunit B [Helcococcus]|uniref:ATP synthase subunit b n=1 Tax=Helcococcus bovis TaxID=3153252 RepID=A0ABW9F7T2_9FIRM
MGIEVKIIPEFPGVLIQLAATLILFLVVRHFLYKPVKDLLEKRQAFIEKSIRDSEFANAEAQRIKAEYDTKILEAKQESSEIISKARSYGEDIKNKAIQESKELAKVEYEKGVLALETEKIKVMKSMNDEIADMAISAAEKVLREKVNIDTDKNLVKSFIKDLEESYE